jgi:hypothetical protein
VRPAIAVALVALVAFSLWYVVAPPRDPAAYRDRASESAQTLLSQLRTAKTWARALEEDKTIGPSALVGLDDSEKQAKKATANFTQYEPPRGTDEIRIEFTTISSVVTDELGKLRIAAQRREWETVVRAQPRLEELATKLEDFRRRLRA